MTSLWRLLATVVLVAVAVVVATVAEVRAEERPVLLAQKSLLSSDLVLNRESVVVVRIFNVGTAAAADVQLRDDSFSDDRFNVSSGLTSARWDRLPAGANVSHTFVVVPRVAGDWSNAPARVSYRSVVASSSPAGASKGAAAGAPMTVHSSTLRHARVLARPEGAQARTLPGRHQEWAVLLALTAASTALPLLVWTRARARGAALGHGGVGDNAKHD